MAIMGKTVLITGDESSSEYSDAVSVDSLRSIENSQPLSLSSAVQVVEGLRSCKGMSKSQILITLRNMGASENTINLAIKRNSQINSVKKGEI